jgi:hypothetical protein
VALHVRAPAPVLLLLLLLLLLLEAHRPHVFCEVCVVALLFDVNCDRSSRDNAGDAPSSPSAGWCEATVLPDPLGHAGGAEAES